VNRAWAILAAGALLASAAAKENPARVSGDAGNPGNGINVYSLEREVELGRKMAADVERQASLLDDPVVVEYVNRISQNLVRNSDARVPFTVKVVDSHEINAFALPGGFLFVNTGMILRTHSEAELAGVLAHEIAHVAARHGTKQATRKEIVNYVSMPLVLAGGWLGYSLRQLVGLAVPMGFTQFTRGMERQADTLGLQYLYRSGYDPLAFVDFFERMGSLEKSRPGLVTRMFSSHPLTADRIRSAQRQIQRHLEPRASYVVDTSEFENIRARLAQLEDPAVPRRRGDGPVLHHRVNRNDPASDDTAQSPAPQQARNGK
jgi:predicted Zn-dependent protease